MLVFAFLMPTDAFWSSADPVVNEVDVLVPGSSYWYDLFGDERPQTERPLERVDKETVEGLVKVKFLELQDEYLEGVLYGDYIQEVEALRAQVGELRAFVKTRMDLVANRSLVDLLVFFFFTMSLGWGLMAWRRKRVQSVQTVQALMVAEPVVKEGATVAV